MQKEKDDYESSERDPYHGITERHAASFTIRIGLPIIAIALLLSIMIRYKLFAKMGNCCFHAFRMYLALYMRCNARWTYCCSMCNHCACAVRCCWCCLRGGGIRKPFRIKVQRLSQNDSIPWQTQAELEMEEARDSREDEAPDESSIPPADIREPTRTCNEEKLDRIELD